MASNDPQAVHDNIGTRKVNHNIRFTSYELPPNSRPRERLLRSYQHHGHRQRKSVPCPLAEEPFERQWNHLAKGSIDQYFNHWLHPFSIYKIRSLRTLPITATIKPTSAGLVLFITDSAPPNNGDSIPLLAGIPAAPCTQRTTSAVGLSFPSTVSL